VNVDDGGARLDWSNLRASCRSCNIGKRNTEVAARAREARGRAPRKPTPAAVTVADTPRWWRSMGDSH
jgi:5-methylcytosine-specific restriction endonuclease McrA